MTTIPRIISVDDHVVEPPDLWTNRLPAKYQDRAPRVERDRGVFKVQGGDVLLREGRPRRRVGRLVDLRRPDLPVPEAVGRDRLRQPGR